MPSNETRFFNVYVPKPGKWLEREVAPQSAIVGTVRSDGTAIIDYEGNLYGSCPTFRDRVVTAVGRHAANYPTVARRWVIPDVLVFVGRYDIETGELSITNQDGLAAWLGGEFEMVQPRANS